MHIRFVTNRRGDKVFRYPQLVESFRRPDGMPAHRVLAGLSKLSELELDNLRKALAASREGRPLGPSSGAPVLPTIRKNLVVRCGSPAPNVSRGAPSAERGRR